MLYYQGSIVVYVWTMLSDVCLVNTGSKRALNCHALMKVLLLSDTNEVIMLERLQYYQIHTVDTKTVTPTSRCSESKSVFLFV